METQDDHKIESEMDIQNGLENVPYQLDLLNNLDKLQITIEERTDQKEGNEMKSEVDLQKLSDQFHIKDGKEVETTEEELSYDHQIFGYVFRKMLAFAEKSKQETFEKSLFIDEWKIFNDIFNLIEKHEESLTDEDILIGNKGLKFFIHATYNVKPNGLFLTDLIYAKEIFYLYFNLLNIKLIQNHLKNDQIYHHSKIFYRPSICRILDVMIDTSAITDLNLNDTQRPWNSIQLLSLLFNYVKRDLNSSNLSLKPSSTDVSMTRKLILLFLWCYSDKIILVTDLIEVGALEIMIDILTMISETDDVDIELEEQILVIIYNISRHDDGGKQLNILNADNIIKHFQIRHGNDQLNTTCCMALALLSTPEQIKNDSSSMNDVLDTLLKMLYEASLSSIHRTKDGIHFSEILIVFVKLFNDDRTLHYIMEHPQNHLHQSSIIQFFINQLIFYHSNVSQEDPLKEATCTALINILWSISFQDNYKQQLTNSKTEFKQLITNLTRKSHEKISSNQYIPKYIENIEKAGRGILFNIDELTEQVHHASTPLDNNEKSMIMISYSHEDTLFCKQLYDQILKRGYDVWIDFLFLKTGDLWEQIAGGMKRANVILCLMSEDYCKSKSCRWEATYALDKLQTTKSIIPVFLRKHQLPDWLEIRTAVLKYVRFRDLKELEDDKLFELLDMIDHSLRSTIPPTNLHLHPPVLPTHQQVAVSISGTKDNKLTSESNNVLPVYHEKVAEAKSSGTKIKSEDISSKINSVLNTSTNPNLYSEKVIEEWNESDISQWFEDNQIVSEFRDLCHFKDGYEILNYANIFLDTEKLQYQIYSEEFLKRDGITSGKKPLLLHQFTKFSNALRKLEILKKSK